MTAFSRVLVTGGAGFIGSHTVDLLLRQNKQVVVLDNLSTGKLTNLNLQHPNLELIEGDVLEYPLVKELIADCDAVLHLAAIASVAQSLRMPIYAFQVNTQGFLHVLHAVRECKHKPRFVYASSAAVYGDSMHLPCDDRKPLLGSTRSPYALQKIHCENYAALYHELHACDSLALRYFNVYGTRQTADSEYAGVIHCFLKAYQKNSPFIIYGDGKQSRDFIHVEDVAQANLLALNSDYNGALNIATGLPQTILQLVNDIEFVGKKRAQLTYQSSRSGDVINSYGTTELAEHQLGFAASIKLNEGIAMLMAEKK